MNSHFDIGKKNTAQLILDHENLFFFLYAHPDDVGYDPHDDLDKLTLAAMNGGLGTAAFEYSGAARIDVSTLTPTAVIPAGLNESRITLAASTYTYSSLAAWSGHRVGGVIVCGQTAAPASDADRWPRDIIKFPENRDFLPDGGDFELPWPNTGILRIR